MKPHQLVIEAMGPYGGTEVVEFAELAAEGLFLIHGRTGSGKTSLLDAISFALYGEVPGERDKAQAKRSHHAADGARPSVTLEFDSQGARYRVERQPTYRAVSSDGTPGAVRNTKAVLQRIDRGDPETLATGSREVTNEVVHLLGLTAKQFQQVILLPQGKFEAVLQADSKKREELLETLFETHDFHRATRWLDDQAKARYLVVTEARRGLDALAEQAVSRLDDVEPHGEPSEPAAAADEAEQLELVPSRSGQELLDHLVARAAAALDTATAAKQVATQARAAAQQAFDHATGLAERQARRAALLTQHQELQEAAAQVQAARAQLELAERAEHLRPSLEQVAQTEAAVATAQHEAETSRARAQQAADAPELPATLQARELDLATVPAPRLLAPASTELAEERTRLDGLRAVARQEATARAAAIQADLLEAEHRQDASSTEGLLPDLIERHQAAERAAQEATTAADQLAALQDAAARATAHATAARDLVGARTALHAAERVHLAAREKAVAAGEHVLDLTQRRLAGMAAELAHGLADGAACPVCGSADHPMPARPAPDAVTAEQVEAAAAREAELKLQREQRGEAAAEASTRVVALIERAGPYADDATAAELAAGDAQAAAAAAQQAVSARPSLQQRAAAALAAIDDAKAAVVASTAAADQAHAKAADQREQADTHRTTLDQGLGAQADLDATAGAVAELEAALSELGQHAARSNDLVVACTATRERATADVAASPFADADEARAALLPAADRRSMADQISRHERRLAEVEGQLAATDLADLPDQVPDVEAATVALRDATTAAEAAQSRHGVCASTSAAVADLAERHRTEAAALVDLEAEATLYGSVARRCAGLDAPKVPLQRWVLATYLEEICQHANRRLATMTSGRYQLRVERGAVRANAQAGLDLRVHDAHTDQEREVSTLSGGETFQASLALALGVADSVEAHTGGVRLEALFVDEGFGTLDTESLELAMDELDQLRQGGRMVGLISHVSVLRERIRLGIEVTATDQGSHVRVGPVAAV